MLLRYFSPDPLLYWVLFEKNLLYTTSVVMPSSHSGDKNVVVSKGSTYARSNRPGFYFLPKSGGHMYSDFGLVWVEDTVTVCGSPLTKTNSLSFLLLGYNPSWFAREPAALRIRNCVASPRAIFLPLLRRGRDRTNAPPQQCKMRCYPILIGDTTVLCNLSPFTARLRTPTPYSIATDTAFKISRYQFATAVISSYSIIAHENQTCLQFTLMGLVSSTLLKWFSSSSKKADDLYPIL